MVAKRERWAKPDVKQIESDLQATDEVVRSHGVRGLCPCHGARDVLEQKVDVLMRSLRDPSRLVRRMALHVFDDAAVMQSKEELKYCLEPGEEKIAEKPAHSRPMERRLEARAIESLKGVRSVIEIAIANTHKAPNTTVEMGFTQIAKIP